MVRNGPSLVWYLWLAGRRPIMHGVVTGKEGKGPSLVWYDWLERIFIMCG